MLSGMIDDWALWLFMVGLVTGVVVAAVLLWRLPRREDDVPVEERQAEAAWIADTIERHGGSAPVSFVEEVLDLHQAYLGTVRPPGPPPGAAVPPLPAPPVGSRLPSMPAGYAPPPGQRPPSRQAPPPGPPPAR